MPKNIVVAILEKKHFYDKDSIDRSTMMEMSQPYTANAAASPNRYSLNQDKDREFEPPREPLLPKRSQVS